MVCMPSSVSIKIPQVASYLGDLHSHHLLLPNITVVYQQHTLPSKAQPPEILAYINFTLSMSYSSGSSPQTWQDKLQGEVLAIKLLHVFVD